ncbi:DUF6286 domain-containing protein [Nocardia sp. alder85J]|uniref:DUF6286 domain-containing protein n=1 Tax=Nocardia sp. alder85J TaxID=2862949 RepID=UPI001CD71CE6|nr:DUF6286 domain-containing protein [Nocardia sp. alder85J]MCX4097043.1 DUF6286 domain-containing protein [Nocardia sp. alder85J]
MIRRPHRAVPAAVLALALLGISTAVALTLIPGLTGAPDYLWHDVIVRVLHDISWNDARVAAAGLAAVAGGVALLALAVLPDRTTVLPLAAGDEIAAGVVRSGLHRALGAAAQSVDGVHSVRVRLHRRKIRVVARTSGVRSPELRQAVRDAVDAQVTRIAPAPSPRVTARVCRIGLGARQRNSRRGGRR